MAFNSCWKSDNLEMEYSLNRLVWDTARLSVLNLSCNYTDYQTSSIDPSY
jgi:hypothetical protein